MRIQNNKQLVLNIIRNKGPIGRAQIAKLTDLTIPSVMKITEGLIKLGLVREVGKGESTGGKPPILLEIVEDSYYSIGIDIGETKIICVLMNADGIVHRKMIHTKFAEGYEIVLKKIKALIEDVLNESKIDKRRFIGIGLAIPGLLDVQIGQVMFSAGIGWYGVDIISPLSEYFHTYVCMDNATRATAFGEKLYGVAKEVDNYMCINLGYGIGGAMVFNGEVYNGYGGTAGEFGHMIAIPGGPLCVCGNRGCLEAVSSSRALVRDASARLKRGESSVLNNWIDGDYSKLEAKMIYDAAKMGDELSKDIVMNALQILGTSIAGIINLLDFELIILEGGISRNGAFFFDNLMRIIDINKMRFAGRRTKIVVSDLGVDATAIGAASLVIDKLLERGGDIYLMLQKNEM